MWNIPRLRQFKSQFDRFSDDTPVYTSVFRAF